MSKKQASLTRRSPSRSAPSGVALVLSDLKQTIADSRHRALASQTLMSGSSILGIQNFRDAFAGQMHAAWLIAMNQRQLN